MAHHHEQCDLTCAAILAISDTLDDGDSKYTGEWRDKPDGEHLKHAKDHVDKFWNAQRGDIRDLNHAICRLVMLKCNILRREADDDKR